MFTKELKVLCISGSNPHFYQHYYVNIAFFYQCCIFLLHINYRIHPARLRTNEYAESPLLYTYDQVTAGMSCILNRDHHGNQKKNINLYFFDYNNTRKRGSNDRIKFRSLLK